MSKDFKEFRVEDGCIRCGACAEIAEGLYRLTADNQAYEVSRQPSSEEEAQAMQEALENCPVGVITAGEVSTDSEASTDFDGPEVITAESKVRQTFERSPQLMKVMVGMDPIFRRLQNKVLWNTVARYASFRDAARISKVSVCEILHVLNKANGTLDQMAKSCPECIEGQAKEPELKQEAAWDATGAEELDLRDREAAWLERAVNSLQGMSEGQKLLVRTRMPLQPLIDRAEELGIRAALQQGDGEVHHSFFCEQGGDWREEAKDFEKLDVRGMVSDPFDVIMQKAYSIEEGGGFILIQTFEPAPIINMLSAMDFEAEVEKKGEAETWVTFHKKASATAPQSRSDRVPVVIQSATPVGYPVIMRLLQSKALQEKVEIKELKVWEETEKHLAWIVNGKADITFSAVITATKLAKMDVKMPAVFVWDNFHLLTRGYEAKGLEDLRGKTIHAPLFREAPPTAITRYLIRKHGLDEADFKFTYGTPFGRPERILRDFLQGKSDTVLLREPEASFAIAGLDPEVQSSVLSFHDLWNKVNPGYGSFPNAGVLLKGEFIRKHPEIAKLVMQELEDAIEWVNAHRDDAARLSFDMMRNKQSDVRLFLDRVHFRAISGPELQDQALRYLQFLRDEEIITIDLPEDFGKMFELGV